MLLSIVAGCRTGERVVKPEPKPGQFFIMLGKGVDALQRSDYPAAIHFLKLAVAERPASTKALNLRGVAWFMKGKTREAEADFAKVIQLDPGYETAYQNLGCALLHDMKLAEAERILRQALYRFPAGASAYFTLGTVLILQSRGDEAMAMLRKGLELDPDYFSRENQFSTELNPQDKGNPELLFSYARLFAAKGNIEKTVDYLRQAKKAGFRDWRRIGTMADFDPVRVDPALKEFID
jgi:tetratricopeptide (TPR) repeat protein